MENSSRTTFSCPLCQADRLPAALLRAGGADAVGFSPCQAPKRGCCQPAGRIFVIATYFFDSVDNRAAKPFWLLQHRAEITANPGSVRVGGLISSAQVVLIYSCSPRVTAYQGKILQMDAHLSSPATRSCRRVTGVRWVWGRPGTAGSPGISPRRASPESSGQTLRTDAHPCEPGCHRAACLL